MDVDDGFYQFSLKLDEIEDSQTFVKMQFSQTNKYLAVQCTHKLMIFEYQSALNAPINEATDDEVTRFVEPTVEFTVSEMTYDRILG